MSPRGLISQLSNRLLFSNSTKNKSSLQAFLKKPHPDLKLFLYALEIHEQLFFRKPLNGYLLKQKKKRLSIYKLNNNNNNM